MPVLQTPRLIIRDVVPADAEAFCHYMQREAYWRDLPIDPPTPQSVAAMVAGCVRDQAIEPRTRYFMAAVDQRSHALVGEAILHIRGTRTAQGEIGWGVDSDHVNQGLATEIGRTMLQLGFQTLRLHRIFARCRPENLASRRIMSKLGMREEGVSRDDVLARGNWWSSVQCSILSSD